MDDFRDRAGPSRQYLTVVGEFLLDRETIRVWRGNRPLQISMRQFRLLDVFMRHAGEPLSLSTLKELIWGPGSTIEEATVAAEIMRLRRAIGGRRRESPIRTVRKLGYVFEASRRSAATRERPFISDASTR